MEQLSFKAFATHKTITELLRQMALHVSSFVVIAQIIEEGL